MRFVSPRRPVMGAMAVLGTLALAGCAPQPVPALTPAPTTTDAPVFASDADALAAATEAYAAYLAASDASGEIESASRREFLALSTGEAHKEDIAAEATFDERGWRKTGTTAFDSLEIQSYGPVADGGWLVRAYLCLDVSRTDVLDKNGASVAQMDRPLRLPMEVALSSFESEPARLLISESRVWSGSNFC